MQLVMRGGKVADARFLAFGCPAALAAASAACARLAGVTVLEALAISADDLDRDLGGLGAERRHGPEMVIDALGRAFEGWFSARLGDMGLPLSSRRVAVAMSGGVDSAVAAMLLTEQGWDVVGVTMRLWHDPGAAAAERSCCSPETVQMARATSHALGIPHLVLDAAETFRKGVVEDFIAGYAAGRTPNPCVTCNGSVRFRLLAQAAALVGARGLATGHYARVVREEGEPVLAVAADRNKDQSYMLSRLDARIRARLVLPLGDMQKARVREIAHAAGLPAADAVESQEVCFVGEGGYQPFLERNAGLGESTGPIVDSDGRVLGEHSGYWRYTVGQRRGIGVSSADPLYVLATDAASNTVVVGPREQLATHAMVVDNPTIHAPIDSTETLEVKVRYRGRSRAGRAVPNGPDSLRIELDEPADGVAPGQTAALYRRGRLVGAGTITSSGTPPRES
jgi:tRNA-uridine 2-sulfurtransferase